MTGSNLRPVLLLVLVPVLALSRVPQDLSERQAAFYSQYKVMVDTQDLKGINKLASKQRGLAEECIDQILFRFAQTGDPKLFDEIAPLATAVDEVDGGKRFAKLIEYVRGLAPEQRPKWLNLRNDWPPAITAFNEAHQKKEPAGYRLAASSLEDIAKSALALKDVELASFARYNLGLAHEGLSEYEAVVRDFDLGIDEWKAAERPKDQFYQYMVDKRRELIEKGFDPAVKDKPAGEVKAKEKVNNTTSYKEGADWQDWETEYREMKSPEQFTSVSPWSTDHILLWREFGYSEDPNGPRAHDLGAVTRVKPFGTALNIVRDGAKGFIDLNDDKKPDVPVKIIDGKPTLAVIKGSEAKDAPAYALWLATGGQAQWFQTAVNYQNRGSYRCGCYREGKILGETIVILDDNCSGVFGDPQATQDNLLRTYPPWTDTDAVIVGKGKAVPWSDVLQVGDKWYHFKLADGQAAKLRTRELDIQTGQVLVKWNGPVQPKVLVLEEIRDFKGSFFDVAGGKPVSVPVGRYELAYGYVTTGKGAQLKLAWLFKGDSKPFEVKPGEVTTLDMGAPYTFGFNTENQGKAVIVKGKSLLARDKSGAIVGRVFDEVFYPEVSVRHEGGAAIGKPKAMSKISTEVFNKDNVAAWFPADFVIEKAEKAKLDVKLELKKHALLGGPFASEWK